jgi:hypothetical protein
MNWIRIDGLAMTNNKCLHLYHSITASADNLICYKINTVHLVRVTRKIRFDFVRFEVPDLCATINRRSKRDLYQTHLERGVFTCANKEPRVR